MAKPHKKKSSPVNYDKLKKQQEKAILQVRVQSLAPITCANGQLNVQFQPLDTWFFRESRPHDAVGASELSSLFPPSVRTLIGAVRSYLGEQLNIDWQAFKSGQEPSIFIKAVGGANDLGKLSVYGPWVCLDGQRLYPAPFYLLQKEDEWVCLHIGNSVRCDLGTVRLPELPMGKVGFKNLDQAWITRSGWEKLLSQQVPCKDDIILQKNVLARESRLGIARNNQTRTVQEGKLYQTQHIRLKEAISIELDVLGLESQLVDKFPQNNTTALIRLGGEGRMAAMTSSQQYDSLPNPTVAANEQNNTGKFIIHFITPADFKGSWFPEKFEKCDHYGTTVWQGDGDINGIKLRIISAVIGKTHREGGWNMQEHQPRPVKSYIPAGSAWFCELIDKNTTWQTLLEKLHGHCIGNDTEFGRGQILIGFWHDNSTN